MKKSRIVLAAVAGLSGALTLGPLAQAQEKKDEKPEAKPVPPKPAAPPVARPAIRPDRTESLAQFLKLNDEQKAKVRPIMEEETKKLTELLQDKTVKPEERRAKYMEVREAANAKIKPILTEEQWEKFSRMRGLGTKPATAAPAAPTQPAPAPAK